MALWRGLTLRCARCGQGGLFTGWFRMVEQCPRCGLRFEQDEGSRLGSAMVNYSVVAVAMIAYIIVALVMTVPDVPVLPIVIGAGCLVIVVAVIGFPFGKTVWSAIDYVLKGYDVP